MQNLSFRVSRSVLIATSSIVLFLCTLLSFAQERVVSLTQIQNLTTEEQIKYLQEARKRGYSLAQLENIAKTQGATLENLSLLRDAWLQSLSDETGKPQQKKLNFDQASTFGNEPETLFLFEKESDVFGSAFFANKKITETPQFYVATPSGYRLGPSDEITIDVWGASENRYEATLSRQGVVRIDRLRPMYLSGLTLAAAERKIRNEFSSIYTGLSPNSPNESKVYLDVNLQKARSVVVNITGSVEAPGTYTISGFSSVLNALYAAGGPTENGSYRDVSILRNGKEVASVDLYDYFVKGTYPSFFLNDQDVIVVAPHHNRISVEGAFKNTGRFETLENETIEDLLSYAGGFSSVAYKKAIYVDRAVELQREIIIIEDKDYSTTQLTDGDVVEAKNITDKYTNRISVSGEVYLPGDYPLNETPTISILLKRASGLTPNAYAEAAILYRSKQGFVNEIKTIDLEDIISQNKDVILHPNDSLVVVSSENIKPKRTVSVQGLVNNPDTYDFYEGMTARDLILIANGFKDKANTKKIELFSNTSSDNSNEKVAVRSFSFNESNKEELLPSDLLVVRNTPGFRPTGFVTLKGQALNPGAYPLTKKNYRIYDLFKDSGGSIGDASDLGILVERIILEETKENIEDTSDTLDLFEKDEKTTIKIGIDFSKVISKRGDHPDNIILKPKDKIVFLEENSTVSILGEVQQETSSPFSNGLTVRQAITAAGGFKAEGDKKNVFVVYQNGKVRGTKSFLFFRISPKLKPGSVIVVPEKASKRPLKVQETLGLASTLASLALIVRSFTTSSSSGN